MVATLGNWRHMSSASLVAWLGSSSADGAVCCADVVAASIRTAVTNTATVGSAHFQRTLRMKLTITIIKRYPKHRSEEHTSELQSLTNLVCRLLLEKKKKKKKKR